MPEVKYSRLSFSPLRIFATVIFIFSILFIPGCKKKNDQAGEYMPMLWESQQSAEIYYSSPAISLDEKTIYIGTSLWISGVHDKTNTFVALDAATGEERWHIDLGKSEVRSTPAVASDNSIYFGVELRDPMTGSHLGDELWHVSSSGQTAWKYNINPSWLSFDIGQYAPAIGSDGTVYIAGDKLYAVTPDGTLKWSAFGTTGEALHNSPSIGRDGTVYFVHHNIPLTALDPDDGSVIWSCPLGVNDHCNATPAIAEDGTIYIATQPGLLYAVSSSGNILWTFSIASAGFTGTLRSSPSVGSDGSIYFGINNGNPSSAFFAINSDGSLKWKFEPSGMPDDIPSDHFDIYSSPALGTDGFVYFGQEFGLVFALKTADGSLAGTAETNSGITWPSPAIDSKGVLYIADLSGIVYAFQTESQGLDPEAQWPKFRYNNRNTGRTD